ncbi:MAG: hypothetical protein WCO19_03115 [Candidatus Saccharibacteria bacterium]
MPVLDIPPKPNLSKQLLMTAVVLILVAIIVAIFAKAIIGFIIFLLGAIMGIGSQVTKDNPLDPPTNN